MKDASFNTILTRLMIATKTSSQSEMAVALGVTPQAVTDAKRRGKIPNNWIMAAVANYGVRAEDLLAPDDAGLEPDASKIKIYQVDGAGARNTTDMMLEKLLASKDETIAALKDQVENLKDQVARLQAENRELREDARRGGVAIHSTAALNFAQSAPLTSQRSD